MIQFGVYRYNYSKTTGLPNFKYSCKNLKSFRVWCTVVSKFFLSFTWSKKFSFIKRNTQRQIDERKNSTHEAIPGSNPNDTNIGNSVAKSITLLLSVHADSTMPVWRFQKTSVFLHDSAARSSVVILLWLWNPWGHQLCIFNTAGYGTLWVDISIILLFYDE